MKRAIENRRKGMTLVELIVGFALVAILSASLVSIIAPVYRTYQRTRAVSDAEALAGNIIDALRTSANSASELSKDGNDVIVGVIRYFVPKSGRLMYEVIGAGEPAKPVFDEKYYNGKTIMMNVNQMETAENTVQVTIHVTTKDKVTVSQSGVISTLRQYIQGSHNVLSGQGSGTDDPEDDDPPDGGGTVTPGSNPSARFLDALDSELDYLLLRRVVWAIAFFRTTPSEYFRSYYEYTRLFNWFNHPTPEGDVKNLLTQEELLALRNNTTNANAIAMYDGLLQHLEGTYLAMYFTKNADRNSNPILYVTPNSSLDTYTKPADEDRSPYADMYFVYYESTWYIRNPDNYNADADWAIGFDGKSEDDIAEYLNSKTDYWKLAELQIPKK